MAHDDGSVVSLVGLDRHGDVTWLADPTTGVLSDSKVYDPFGEVAAVTGVSSITVGFQGDYTDPASGEVWMGARWYDPTGAQFRSRDTIFGELMTPVSLNRYTYGFASPLVFWDPDGRFVTSGAFIDGEFASARAAAKQKAVNVRGKNLRRLRARGINRFTSESFAHRSYDPTQSFAAAARAVGTVEKRDSGGLFGFLSSAKEKVSSVWEGTKQGAGAVWAGTKQTVGVAKGFGEGVARAVGGVVELAGAVGSCVDPVTRIIDRGAQDRCTEFVGGSRRSGGGVRGEPQGNNVLPVLGADLHRLASRQLWRSHRRQPVCRCRGRCRSQRCCFWSQGGDGGHSEHPRCTERWTDNQCSCCQSQDGSGQDSNATRFPSASDAGACL